MSNFNSFKSVKKLKKLAKKPIDLRKELTAKRINSMYSSKLGLKLMYATERVTDEVMETLFECAKEANAMQKMADMQAGKTINKIFGIKSEERAVLHTAMRDFFDKVNTADIAAKSAKLAYIEYEKLNAFLMKIKRRNFTDIVQVGIGGSDLGPRAVYFALKKFKKKNVNAHFISNVDPDDVTDVISRLNLKKTLVIVVSKSGNTLETRTNERFIRKKFKDKNIDPAKHIVAVTGKSSPMDNKKKYLESFYIWDYVGGRYSVTSMVGGVLLACTLGMEHYTAFLQGASAMDKHALYTDASHNLPLIAALIGIWNRNFLHIPTLAIIPYSQALIRFTAHLQQCDMESNGKMINKQGQFVNFDTGPIIWGEPGTNSQHSFFQLVHQGTSDIALEFIGFAKSQYKQDIVVEKTTSQQKLLANLFAQSIALAQGKKNKNVNKYFIGNRPNSILLANTLTPNTMGKILSYYENKIAFQGFIWGINSFDQEGVQLGKVLANTILKCFADDQEAYPLGHSYLNHIKSL